MKQRSHAYCQNIKNALRGLYSREGAVVLAVGLLLVVLAAATWLHQPQSYSPVENRGMAWFLDWSNVTKAHFSEDFETHVQDQFPLRNQFRQGKALVDLYALGQRDVDGVYETGGWMAELEYPRRTGMLDHVAQKIQWVYDHYLAGTDATCYLSVVPDKHYYLSQTNGYPALDYDGLIRSLRAQIPAMPYIDLTDLLSTGGSNNYGRFNDANFTALLTAERTAVGDAHADAAAKLYEAFCRQTPIAPICFARSSILTTSGAIEGLTPSLTDPFYNLQDWTIHFS